MSFVAVMRKEGMYRALFTPPSLSCAVEFRRDVEGVNSASGLAQHGMDLFELLHELEAVGPPLRYFDTLDGLFETRCYEADSVYLHCPLK